MIGSLHGLLTEKEAPRLLVDVQGVGYEVEVPMSTFLALPAPGNAVRLKIHHVLREDASLLFGFVTEDERALFRALLRISGVGPRMALSILSGVSAEGFQLAIASEDAASLTRIPGVGRKTAERLLVEMRDHFTGLPKARAAAGAARTPREEALEALIRLDYKPAEAARLLEAVGAANATTEELLRAALRSAAAR